MEKKFEGGFASEKEVVSCHKCCAYAMNRGYTEIIDADLSKYFDTIPHANLLAVVAERISDGEILRIIKMWLKAPVKEEGRDGKQRNISGGKGNRKGTPQGGLSKALDNPPCGAAVGNAFAQAAQGQRQEDGIRKV